MPYKIVKDTTTCPTTKPWAVQKRSDNKHIGCHPTQESAKKQIAALETKENATTMDALIRRQRP